MPIQPTYPGVYIEEIPSGVRTITGVATSITAFIGRAARGPVNDPVTITSYGDFERAFGGLLVNYPMSYAVRDFYLNGGSEAIIVRLFRDNALEAARAVAKAAEDTTSETPADVVQAARTKAGEYTSDPEMSAVAKVVTAAETAAAQPNPTSDKVKKAASDAADGFKTNGIAKLNLPIDNANTKHLKLEAASHGAWGNKLNVKVDYIGITDEVAKRYGSTDKTLFFNLTVTDTATEARERIVNLTVIDGPRRIDRVLEQESRMIRIQRKSDGTPDWPDPLARPKDGATATGGTGANGENLNPALYLGNQNKKTGLFALDKADLFNLLCISADIRDEDTDRTVYQAAMSYCFARRAMLLVDSPVLWGKNKDTAAADAKKGLTDLGLNGDMARNAALYFPRVVQSDPNREGQLDTFVPCGIIAGVMARTDVSRGVWKAPAGIDAALNGIQSLQVNLNDAENGQLNPLGINCLRSFPITGRVVWGARTLRGADQLADEYKYVPVRRLVLYIEESLYRGTKWVVFEPNDEPLWAQIRLNIGAFMHNLFRQGAFQGKTRGEAYFVKCDKETTTQNDINLGIVNIVVGFAPLKPAEFVIIKIQQMAGPIEA